MARAKQSSRILCDVFDKSGIETTQFGLPHLDAKTATDYLHVIKALRDIPRISLQQGLPIPQAAILITHAHNVVGHFLSKYIAPDFIPTSAEDALFVDCLNDMAAGNLREDDFERYRKMLVDPTSGLKAHYSEMNIFDLFISRWSDFREECGNYEATIIPREEILYSPKWDL